ncbi:MAG: ectoine hydrolase [Octadecabacter sp.]|jgi:ectoine hydrolase
MVCLILTGYLGANSHIRQNTLFSVIFIVLAGLSETQNDSYDLNTTDKTTNFTRPEYQAGITKTRVAMVAVGLSAIFVTDPSNMSWLTVYDGWSFYVHQRGVLTMKGEPIWWGRAMVVVGAGRTVFMNDSDNIRGYDDSFAQNPKHPMQELAILLEANRLDHARIGVEMDNYYYTDAAHASLTTNLSHETFEDATGHVNWQCTVKSPQEITYMRHAAYIVETRRVRIVEIAQPGLRKNNLITGIYATDIRGTDRRWGDYPTILPVAPSGMGAIAPHLTWDGRLMEKGEVTFFEITGAHRRYQYSQSRTLFLGDDPTKYRNAEAAVLDAIDAGLDQAKLGNQAQNITNAFNVVLSKADFEKKERCGYAICISYPPDWGKRTISFRASDKTGLEAATIFNFMPAL